MQRQLSGSMHVRMNAEVVEGGRQKSFYIRLNVSASVP